MRWYLHFSPLTEGIGSSGMEKREVGKCDGMEGMGAMFVGTQKKLPKKERGRKEKGENYIISHLIKSSH